MRCTKCGNEIVDNAKFCGKCGNKVLAETQEFSSKEHVAGENQNSEKQGMKPKKIIGIVAILIIAGTSALLSGIFKTKNMGKNEAIISCGIEGSNLKLYEYNGKLKELNMSAKYNYVLYIGEERFVVGENEKRLIDINDKLIKSFNYQFVYPFSEGLARVEAADGKWGYIDKEGKEVISPKYEISWYFGKNTESLRIPSGIVYNYDYDYEGEFSDGLIVVIKDGKAGVINQEGEVIIPTIYDYISITRR